MSNIYLKSIANIPLNVSTGDISGMRPSTFVLQPGEVFFGDPTSQNIKNLVQGGYLAPVTGAVVGGVLPLELPTPVSAAFAGVNNAGPGSASIAIASAVAGQRVYFILDTTATDLTPAVHFESTISVNGFIKQTLVGDLSTSKYAVLLI